jgi:hypothetical protein
MRLNTVSELDPTHGRCHPYVLHLIRRATAARQRREIRGPGTPHRSAIASSSRRLKREYRRARAAGYARGFRTWAKVQAIQGHQIANEWLRRKGIRPRADDPVVLALLAEVAPYATSR